MKAQNNTDYHNQIDPVLCIGHSSLDLNMAINEDFVENRKYRSRMRRVEPGGPAGNAASLIAKWCGPDFSYYAGPLGTDRFGELVKREMEEGGVNCRFVQNIEKYPTPVSAVISNKKNGSRTIVNHRIIDDLYRYPLEAENCKWGAVLGDGHVPGAFDQFLQKRPDVPSVLDAGSLHPGTEMLYRKVRYLIGSAVFAQNICGTDPVTWVSNKKKAVEGLKLIGAGGKQCIAVTLGEHGTVFFEPGRGYAYCKALDIHSVDTTAAGDIFHGAFSYAIAAQMTFNDALILAAVAAGISTSVQGGFSSIPELHIVKDYIARNISSEKDFISPL